MWFPAQNYLIQRNANIHPTVTGNLVPVAQMATLHINTDAVSTVAPRVVPILDKEEIVARVSPKRYPKTSFHDYSENGDDAMFFLRPTFAAAEEVATIQRHVKFDDNSNLEEYSLYVGHDFRRLYLNFNRTGSAEKIVIPDSLSRSAEEMLLRYSLVGRHMRKIWSKNEEESNKMLGRSFPKEFVANRAALFSFGDKMNQLLNQRMSEEERRALKRFVPQGFQYRTFGQAIFILHLMYFTHHSKSRNTKLFIFALCAIAYSDDDTSIVHVNNLCIWLTRDTCNSCFEKGLFVDFDVSYQYSMVNFEYSDREVTLAKDADLAYRILEHDDPSALNYPPTLYIHEHSFVVMKSIRSTLNFLVGKEGERIEVQTNVHRGAALIMAIDGIVRVARSRLHGGEFGLFNEWVVKNRLHSGDFKNLKMLITDVVMCGIYHGPLLTLSKTVCFCLLFGVVPDMVYSSYQRGDDLRSLILQRLSKGRSRFVDLMVGPCYDCGTNIDLLRKQLDKLPFQHYYRVNMEPVEN